MSINENDVTICSIFVNPTQFNEREDFERYPRVLEKDLKLLESLHCDIIFTPAEASMYEGNNAFSFEIGYLNTLLEGEHRPGHFKGVCEIVNKLFTLVQPDKAYFGQKDYQQLLVIREMVSFFQLPIEIIACPIIRENSGLAMSSRNEHLSEEGQDTATAIYKALDQIKNLFDELSVEKLIQKAKEGIELTNQMRVEYLTILDAKNLKPISDTTTQKITCTAVHLEGVRLIDNMLINS